MTDPTDLSETPLHALHQSLGAKLVPFAGYAMPLQYPMGILKEHLQTRASAGFFDVSHMGQIVVRPRSGAIADAALALERVMPIDVAGLAPGRQRYGMLTTGSGGILDDLMVANLGDHFLLVVNAARKAIDLAHLEAELGADCTLEPLERALIALQGPRAAGVLAQLHTDIAAMRFMDVRTIDFAGIRAVVARSGYTGEDGFEIALEAASARDFAQRLLAHPDVAPVGLGARDSLRLEAGLCLWGNDIDTTTTPVEAALEWAIQPARRPGGARAGGFPGDAVILDQIASGAERRRVGLRPEGRAPMREDTELFAPDDETSQIGTITSGGFGPSLDAPVAMGYVPIALAAPATRLAGRLRGKMLPATVSKMPFITPGYKR